jgi:hypothetical protein
LHIWKLSFHILNKFFNTSIAREASETVGLSAAINGQSRDSQDCCGKHMILNISYCSDLLYLIWVAQLSQPFKLFGCVTENNTGQFDFSPLLQMEGQVPFNICTDNQTTTIPIVKWNVEKAIKYMLLLCSNFLMNYCSWKKPNNKPQQELQDKTKQHKRKRKPNCWNTFWIL